MSNANPTESQPQLPGFAAMNTDTSGDLLDSTEVAQPTFHPPEVAPPSITDSSFHDVHPDSIRQEPGLDQHLPPPNPEEPRRKKTGVFLAIAAAGATLVGAAGLAFASNNGDGGAEQSAGSQVPLPSNTEPIETTVTPTSQAESAIPRTPEFPTSDDPQILLDQLLQNQENALNFALEDPEFSDLSVDLFIPAGESGPYDMAVREEVAAMPDLLAVNSDYELALTGEVLDSDFSNPEERIILAETVWDQGRFGVQTYQIRFTLRKYMVSIDTGELERESREVWLVAGKDTVEPGTFELD